VDTRLYAASAAAEHGLRARTRCVEHCDFIVIGGGIAGASAGFALAEHGRVVLLEREERVGYHATGRSAALFTAANNAHTIRSLTLSSKNFLLQPPAGFSETPLLEPRGALFIAGSDQEELLDRLMARTRGLAHVFIRISAAQAKAMVPVLRESYLQGAVYEPDCMSIDVHALHHGFLRAIKQRAGVVLTGAKARSLKREERRWLVRTETRTFAAPTVINAAGAWADRVAANAGLRPVDLQPMRRTAVLFEPPPIVDPRQWPAVLDIGEQFYFKPEGGNILASPADETPTEPCDAIPDEADVALALRRVNTAADLPVHRIAKQWAGLRSFVPDRLPVVGYDSEAEGFFWLAGQGGFGVHTSPAMGRLCASLVLGRGMPSELAELGLSEASLSPARLKRRPP
jgi:D-arginine dehydrogenase